LLSGDVDAKKLYYGEKNDANEIVKKSDIPQ